jgi:hypothetical protein
MLRGYTAGSGLAFLKSYHRECFIISHFIVMTLYYISDVNALSTGQIRAGTGFWLSSFTLSGFVVGTLPHPCTVCAKNKQKTKQK